MTDKKLPSPKIPSRGEYEDWKKRKLEAEIAKNKIWSGAEGPLRSHIDSLMKEFPGSNMPILEVPEGVKPVPMPGPPGFEENESKEKLRMFKEAWAKRRKGKTD